MTAWAVPPCNRDRWMVSALGMPVRAAHFVRAGAPYRATSLGGYYLAACGYQCMSARADYLARLPICTDCRAQADRRT